MGPGIFTFEVSRLHSDTPHSVVLLCTNDWLGAETSTSQHTTLTRDRRLCPRWDSNPESQQSSWCRSTLLTSQPLASVLHFLTQIFFCIKTGNEEKILILFVEDFPFILYSKFSKYTINYFQCMQNIPVNTRICLYIYIYIYIYIQMYIAYMHSELQGE